MKAKTPISDDIRKQIELRAYFVWNRTGRPEGCQQEHWALAEAEILSEQTAPKAAAPKKPAKKSTAAKPAAKKPSPNKPIAELAAALSAVTKTKAKVAAKAATADAKAKQPAKPKSVKSPPRQR